MKIEPGVPVPAVTKSKGRPPKYDFGLLPVVTDDNETCATIDDASYHTVYACATRWMDAHPGVVLRVERFIDPKDEKNKVRVWRMK